MKRLTSLCLSLLLMLMPLSMSACGSRAPDIEDVYDRLVEVIEASHEVNVVLFGAGLPVYARDSEEEDFLHRYYGAAENGQEYVSIYSKYVTIDDIKEAVSQVYSSEYRESIFETLFTGYASDVVADSILPARYTQNESGMHQNSYVEPLVTGTRVYDYATMTIVSPSNAKFLKVEIQSYAEDHPNEWTTVDLSFVLENGNWYLDGPSC